MQIRQLRRDGYRATSIDEALRLLEHRNSVEKIVVITFDDGYRDFYERAFPVLQDAHFTATVFLVTSQIGEFSGNFNGRPTLDWTLVRELHSRGIGFGSHTVTHPQLRVMAENRVKEELSKSRKTIEDQIGAPVTSFSYPYAFPEAYWTFKRFLKETLIASGYCNAVTTVVGTVRRASDPFFLPRLPVNGCDDSTFFNAKLDGAYDWLHSIQYAAKLFQMRPSSDRW